MTTLEAIAERVAGGAALTLAEAQALLESRDLISLGALADDVRRRIHGARTTFVRVFEVHAATLPPALPPGTAAGEIRIVGRPSSVDEAIRAASAARGLAAGIPVTGFSLADVASLGAPLTETAARLSEAGLFGLAEVSLDTHHDPESVVAVRAGGVHAHRLTVGAYGDVPPIVMLQRAIDLQRAAGGFRAFAPLPRTLSTLAPTTGYDDVKLVALARLMVTDIVSIQVDWPLYGPKLAQVALTMGADDIDGVAAFDPAALGSRRSALAEIVGNIKAAALDPLERNARFEPAA